jgi:hypothetical protein
MTGSILFFTGGAIDVRNRDALHNPVEFNAFV